MSKRARRTRLAAVLIVVFAFIAMFATTSGGRVRARATHAVLPAGITFQGNFEGSSPFSPWGHNPQCANYGASKTTPHYPGSLYLDATTVGEGATSAQIVLPTTPAGHNRTYCTLAGPPLSSTIGTDQYYGLMFYVPAGTTLHNADFSGDNLWEFHTAFVWGAPIAWQLHTGGTSNVNGTGSSVVLALETGACNSSRTSNPGCAYRSSAGKAPCKITGVVCLPGEFAIPPGQVQYGVWNELVMHVHGASNNTGVIETWYKTKGAATWNAGANITGIPTVQWDKTRGCCGSPGADQLEQYTAPVTAPFTVNLDNQLIGTSLAAVEGLMP